MKLNAIIRWESVVWIFWSLTAAIPANALDKASVPSSPDVQKSPWTPSATVALKESFDDNVFLQSVTSNAFHRSFVTAVLPAVGVTYKPSEAFKATFNYAAEINFFHDASSEDFTLHRVGLGLAGTMDKTKWELSENFVAIDGNDIGPSYFGPGGAPAGGGPQIRDRRDALVERGQFKVTQTLGDWFVRPVLAGYLHDFETVQQNTPGYQNFVNRSDWNAGGDAGYRLAETWLTFGYRYGQQTEDKLLTFPEHYDSTYNRLLMGIEGNPLAWLTLSISVGPEIRRYSSSVAAGFNRNEIYPYADSTITISPTKADVLVLSAKRFEQPGFSGRSTYVDATYEAIWRHKFGDKLTVGVGVRAYNTDFLKPTMRNDWIVTPSVLANYAFNRHFSGEISYLYDDAFSLVPNTQGREYTRNLVALGLKYSL